MKSINHTRMFFNALRTAIIFVSGFLIYEILVGLEKLWNKKNPENALYHFHTRKGIKFLLILMIDLLILYSIFITFDIEL
jgi:hypothetical protein